MIGYNGNGQADRQRGDLVFDCFQVQSQEGGFEDGFYQLLFLTIKWILPALRSFGDLSWWQAGAPWFAYDFGASFRGWGHL